METEPIILPSANKHGVTDAAIRHALRFSLHHFKEADSLVMYIGIDETGTTVEVGVTEWYGGLAVIHAMRPARNKYLR